ncbi:MAG: DUF4145 domain-containing protein [Patescibacteria group bacterium]
MTQVLEKCPNCGTAHVMTSDEWNGSSFLEHWRIYRCNNGNCRKLILCVHDGRTGAFVRMFPNGHYEIDESIAISQEIRDEFREAGICLDAGCYKASMVMSRRVLQRCLTEQSCKKRKLVDAIDQAIKKNILRKSFHPIAQEIREYGNLGAHPDDEQLTNATKENAEKIVSFLRLLIHEFYEVPQSAEKLKQQRETK